MPMWTDSLNHMGGGGGGGGGVDVCTSDEECPHIFSLTNYD